MIVAVAVPRTVPCLAGITVGGIALPTVVVLTVAIIVEDAEIIATFLHGGMDQHSSIVMRSPMLIP
jgi:FlaG/FlaF family flagellin (archaellin)